MSFWDVVKEFFSGIFYDIPEHYDMLDVSEGRLTPEEAYKIVLPTAIESGLSYENENAKIGCRKIWLAKDNKRDRIIWMFDFGILEIDGDKNKAEEYFRGLGSIDLDDETGEILGVIFYEIVLNYYLN